MGVEPKWRIKEWFPDLDDRTLERLRIYQIELLRWTKTVNLISPTTIDEADCVHFADSILGARVVLKAAAPVHDLWDIGSGNGFPGVIFSILKPDSAVICVESDERKASFLKQLGMRLELANLGVRCLRVEAIPSGSMMLGCARGFASIERALFLFDKQFATGASFFHFKGPDFDSEMVVANKSKLKWKSSLLGQYTLPAALGDPSHPVRATRFIVKSVKGD